MQMPTGHISIEEGRSRVKDVNLRNGLGVDEVKQLSSTELVSMEEQLTTCSYSTCSRLKVWEREERRRRGEMATTHQQINYDKKTAPAGVMMMTFLS